MIDIIQTILLIFICWFLLAKNSQLIKNMFNKKRRIILDSCALIDGRILQIASKGFINDQLVIPRFIINELQLLADGNDSHKRERARFGLDVANQLQDANDLDVIIDRTVIPGRKSTDDKLVSLARKLKAQLYTTDYNLSKVAALEGVQVLNVNELAQGLRPVTLPGESLTIKLIQKGNGRDQGVGYLDDGTMIVVDGGSRYIGKTVPITVTRMHQTVAGKMVFGQVKIKTSSSNTLEQEKLIVQPQRVSQAQLQTGRARRRSTTNEDYEDSQPVGRSAGRLYSRLQKLR